LTSCTATGVASNGAVRRSNIVTITTASAHGLSVGQKVVISGVSDRSFNSFNPPSTIATVPSQTSFTYQQKGADATSGGGSVSTVPCFGGFRQRSSPVINLQACTHSPVDLILTDPVGFTITL